MVDTNKSKFKNIYGDCITIKSKKVSVEEIEATNIKVYNITAKRISGANVEILGHSSVEEIEYSESLIIHDTCTVKKIVKE